MPRRCPYCGTYNSLGKTNCERCQNSIKHMAVEDEASLRDLRVFAFIFLLISLAGTAYFIYNIVESSLSSSASGLDLFSLYVNFGVPITSSSLSALLIEIEAVFVAILFVYCISFIYLRSTFKKLRKFDFNFSTPTTGTTLLIVGIVLTIIGLGAIALVFSFIGSLPPTSGIATSSSILTLEVLGLILLGALVGSIGGILLVVGYIMGVLLGLHRLAAKFEEPFFNYSLVLIIVSVFFSPLGLIAAILMYSGVRKSGLRMNNAALDEFMTSP